MKQYLTIQNVVVFLLLISQGYLMYKINEKSPTDLRVLQAAQKIADGKDSIIASNVRVIESLQSEKARHIDTLKVINNNKTILREIYRSDVAQLIANDSSEVSAQYLVDYTKSKEMLISGEYFKPVN